MPFHRRRPTEHSGLELRIEGRLRLIGIVVTTDQLLDGKAWDTVLLRADEVVQLFLQFDGHLTDNCRCSAPGLSVGPRDEHHAAAERIGTKSQSCLTQTHD
jgi:hypothetical protein